MRKGNLRKFVALTLAIALFASSGISVQVSAAEKQSLSETEGVVSSANDDQGVGNLEQNKIHGFSVSNAFQGRDYAKTVTLTPDRTNGGVTCYFNMGSSQVYYVDVYEYNGENNKVYREDLSGYCYYSPVHISLPAGNWIVYVWDSDLDYIQVSDPLAYDGQTTAAPTTTQAPITMAAPTTATAPRTTQALPVVPKVSGKIEIALDDDWKPILSW